MRSFGSANPVFQLKWPTNEVIYVKFLQTGRADRILFADRVQGARPACQHQRPKSCAGEMSSTQIVNRIQDLSSTQVTLPRETETSEGTRGCAAKGLGEALVMAPVLLARTWGSSYIQLISEQIGI